MPRTPFLCSSGSYDHWFHRPFGSIEVATGGHYHTESFRNTTFVFFFPLIYSFNLCSLNYTENQFSPDLYVLSGHYWATCSIQFQCQACDPSPIILGLYFSTPHPGGVEDIKVLDITPDPSVLSTLLNKNGNHHSTINKQTVYKAICIKLCLCCT